MCRGGHNKTSPSSKESSQSRESGTNNTAAEPHSADPFAMSTYNNGEGTPTKHLAQDTSDTIKEEHENAQSQRGHLSATATGHILRELGVL